MPIAFPELPPVLADDPGLAPLDVDGFWNWRYVENPGAAWGLLAGARDSVRIPFFLFVPLAAVAFIILFFRKLLKGLAHKAVEAGRRV